MTRQAITMLMLGGLMLTSCTSDNENFTPPTPQQADSQPVAFSTYLGRTPQTRVYSGGDMTQTLLESEGFGVFAYYTGTTDYSSSTVANFMYNQKVTKSGSDWTYSPLKYWPNDISTGNVDNQATNPATGSESGGKVSFFAYAPWVSMTQDGSDKTKDATGSTTTGITAATGNGASKDPILTYKLNFASPQSNVDLLWGTAGNTTAGTYKNVVGTDVTAAAASSATNYYVWKDCTKQKTEQKLGFNFYHALATIGEIKIVLDPNNGFTAATGGSGTFGNTASNGTTNVSVTSVSLSYSGQESMTFNLYTGAWAKIGSTADADHAYTVTDATMNDAIYYANSSEPAAFTALPAGVDLTEKSIFASSGAPLLLFFPGERPEITVTVAYTVRTYDDQLNQGWTSVNQTIKKTIQFGSAFAINTNYKLLLKLGIEDVNFEGTYNSWTDGGTATDVYLPINVKTTT